MYNINKKVLKQLRRLAAELPDIQRVASMDNKKISGEDALLSGLTPPEGEKFDKENEYLIKNPTIAKVNHLLRMKRLFKRHGGIAVIGYCEGIKAQTQK